MGMRGEIFSTRVQLANRTYFFNVKENRMGDIYLNIVESKNKDEGGFERQSIVLFAEDQADFFSGFDEALKVMDKAEREKRCAPRSFSQNFQNSRHSAESGGIPARKKHIVVKKTRDFGRDAGGDSGNAGKKRRIKPVSKKRKD